MDIIESNKLIAEFMGMQHTSIGWYDYEEVMSEYACQMVGGNTFEELQYDRSWDWLMPVVDRIETFNFKVDGVTTSADVHIVYGDCRIVDEDGGGLFEFYSHSTDSGDKLQATYDSVVKFIEWYNLVRKINQR